MGIYTKLIQEKSRAKDVFYLKDLEREERDSKGYKSSDKNQLEKEIESAKRSIKENKPKRR